MRKLIAVAVFIWSSGAFATDIIPLGQLIISDIGSQVTVTGTWTFPDARTPGEQIADPINTSRIVCDKATMLCNEAVARVQNATAVDKQKYLDVDLVPWSITSWTKQEITAEGGALCVTQTLSINLITKEVYSITRNGGLSQDGCKSLSANKMWTPLLKPQIARLVSGLDAIKSDPRTR